MTRPPRLLLLDFDGTVCLGDDPVLAYAEATVSALPAGTADTVLTTLRSYLGGELGPRWADGYQAVKDLTLHLVDEDTRSSAYALSRARLEADELSVHTPQGLHAFLAEAGEDAERVLVTNAPAEGVTGVVERLGLSRLIDAVVPSARKPAGWDHLLGDLLGDRAADAAVSVGDVYVNDIAPLIPHGIATAFIDRHGPTAVPATPTWTAPGFPELYPTLQQWLRSGLPATR